MSTVKTNYAEVELEGKVLTEPKLLAEYGLERIYEVELEYKRNSGKTDRFILNYSTGVMSDDLQVGQFIKVTGSIRTSKFDSIIKIYIMATTLDLLEGEPEVYLNAVKVVGILTRTPNARKSYADENVDISDLTLKVERGQHKVSYIPIVTWNNNARLVLDCEVGGTMTVVGRLQSHTTKNGYLMTEVTAVTVDFNKEV